MAEYNMSYEEIKKFVEDCINKSPDSVHLHAYQSEILAAITARDEMDRVDNATILESIELWKNQIHTPSSLLLGTRYISIKDSVINFIKAALTSGLVDAIISDPQNPMTGISIGVASGIVFALIDVLKSVSELNDFDFCIYMQAVKHFRTHEEFTINDLRQWFPKNDFKCNMHTPKWDCEHFIKDNICDMLEGNHLEEALKSLCDKNILIKRIENGNITYFFRR